MDNIYNSHSFVDYRKKEKKIYVFFFINTKKM